MVCVAESFLNSSCRLDEENENTVGVVDIPLLCRYNVCVSSFYEACCTSF